MTKRQKQTIKREFFNYPRNKTRAAAYIADKAAAQIAIDYSAPRVKSSQLNGVEHRVISEIDAMERWYRWCLVYERTFAKFRWEKKDELMQKRFVEHKSVRKICGEIGLSERTYFAWQDEILATAFLWAKEFGLL